VLARTARPRTVDDLTGRACVYLDGRSPAVASERPPLGARLAVGRPANRVAGLLATLHTLCGAAHRLVADAAVTAACGESLDRLASTALRRSTAREQLLRIAHDWPSLLPHAPYLPDAAVLLRDCPLFRQDLPDDDVWSPTADWLSREWLGMPVSRWLEQHTLQPHDHAWAWCEDAAGPLAALLRSQRGALSLVTPGTSLRPTNDPARFWAALGRQALADPAFAAAPYVDGRAMDTGPWSRLCDDAVGVAGATAWSRLVSRVVDLLRLVVPEGAERLQWGAHDLGDGMAVAWAETSRGMLLHAVRLDATGSQVTAYAIVAPTEWNFAAGGALARAVEERVRHGSGRGEASISDDARRLVVAFDPCVAFDLVPPAGRGAGLPPVDADAAMTGSSPCMK